MCTSSCSREDAVSAGQDAAFDILRIQQVHMKSKFPNEIYIKPGMSGATLSRYRVVYAASGDCDTIHVITKRASLRERRVLTLLTEQHQAVPWCYTLDLTTDTPMLIAP